MREGAELKEGGMGKCARTNGEIKFMEIKC